MRTQREGATITGAQAQQQLLSRAMKDEAFRQELLSDPKTLFEHELGITIPDSVTIQVHEDTSTTVHLVLPERTPGSELWEVDAAELERTYVETSYVTCTIGCTNACYSAVCQTANPYECP